MAKAQILKFKKPIPNRRVLYPPVEKGKKRTGKRRGVIKLGITIPKEKYVEFYHKAKKECPSAAPVHDVLNLLFQYYLEHQFIIHRRMIRINDPTCSEKATKRKRLAYTAIIEGQKKQVKLWIIVPSAENKRFQRRVKREGVSKAYVLNLLIDFYLANQFLIKTTIIRVNRYRTGNRRKDFKILENQRREKELIESLREKT